MLPLPPPPYLLFLVFLALTPSLLPISDSSFPLCYGSRFPENPLRRSAAPPHQEYIEVTRPLPTDSLTPACTLPILSHTFGNSVGSPPTNATYSQPSNCTWSRAALHLSAAAFNGSQHGRVASVWLSGAEILRTITPDSTSPNGTYWNVRKDVTKYSSLLRQSNLTLSVMLENVLTEFNAAVYRVNLTFLFYEVASNETTSTANFPLSLLPPIRNRKLGAKPATSSTRAALKNSISLELNENPADLIIPISSNGDEGFWFKIQSENDAVYQGIKIPVNTYRAVIELYVSFHGDDEFWYSNPPDSYIQLNHLPTKRGHGAFREVAVKINNQLAGSVVPFPIIFPGGINPMFWEPVVSIGAFDVPSYEIELTPFLGMLLDGNVHFLGLGVADAIPFWLVDANLHLWLDRKSDKVQAGAIEYNNPSSCQLERKSKFHQLDGKFEIEGKRKAELSAWVNSSAGNITTHISTKLKFDNAIKFKNNGTVKEVEQKIKTARKMTLTSDAGETISYAKVKRKYPLELTITSLAGRGEDNYLMMTKLENAVEEEITSTTLNRTLENKQKSEGWVFVENCIVVSGAATTHQSYQVTDSVGCYKREVLADGGSIKNDTQSSVCLVPPPAAALSS